VIEVVSLQPNPYPAGPKLVVLQLVTNRLDHNQGMLCEVGACAVDRRLLDNRVAVFTGLPDVDAEAVLNSSDSYSDGVHTSNGLFEDLVGLVTPTEKPYEALDAELAAWLDQVGATGADARSPLITFGVDWAEPWLRKFLPRTLARCGKDRVDLGALLRMGGVQRDSGDGRAKSGAIYGAKVLAALFPHLASLADRMPKS
jgi:hypothetical protein